MPKKNVGIILWCVWHTLDRQMEEALTQFEKWGVAGLKVDFMDRDDQEVVNFYERLAKEAAKRHMLVNFHGAYKPTGLERAYPNVINREAVQGLEYNKFSNKATPEHAVSIPFIRMVAGPMDYTPGALNNVNAEDFRIVSARPVSQGTRCQQLAMYNVVLYAPLEMTSDAPTVYEKEPDILEFSGWCSLFGTNPKLSMERQETTSDGPQKRRYMVGWSHDRLDRTRSQTGTFAF
ncbi:MAG: glycoside hydrolase family 97 catalytic domain-containing protein [Bacteroidales bacterium]